MPSAREVKGLDRLALDLASLVITCPAVALNSDLTLTFKVLNNRLGTPAVMRAECQIIDLKEAEARPLADGAKNSTLRELLTQRRDGAGKHLFGGGLN